MPTPILLLTSWNVHESIEDIEGFVQEAVQKQTEQMQYGLALPYQVLKELSHRHSYPHVLFGALHMNSVNQGAFTQGIAAKMLKMAGASFVLIGSDFERHVLGEGNDTLHIKIVEALKEGVTPILCVGETAEEHLAGKGESIIETQLREGLAGLPKEELERVAVFFQAPWMKQLVHKPTVEEVTRSYDRDHAILAGVVGTETAEKMQIIHTAPEDFEGFHPPVNKGVFTFQHNAHKVYEHARALQEKIQAEEAGLLQAAREAEAVLDEAPPPADQEESEAGGTAALQAFEKTASGQGESEDAAEVEQALIETADSASDESDDAAEVEQALIETASADELTPPEGGELSIPDVLPTQPPKAADAPPPPSSGKIRKDHKISDIS